VIDSARPETETEHNDGGEHQPPEKRRRYEQPPELDEEDQEIFRQIWDERRCEDQERRRKLDDAGDDREPAGPGGEE
jgi:hypothetical protein